MCRMAGVQGLGALAFTGAALVTMFVALLSLHLN